MRITGFQRSVQGAGKPVRKSGDRFQNSMKSAKTGGSRNVKQSKNQAAINNVSTVDTLLVLQDVNVDREHRRKAAKHGGDVLDILEKIKVELLSGRLSVRRLQNLHLLINARPANSNDPHLNALLDQIELRARVELAKLDR